MAALNCSMKLSLIPALILLLLLIFYLSPLNIQNNLTNFLSTSINYTHIKTNHENLLASSSAAVLPTLRSIGGNLATVTSNRRKRVSNLDSLYSFLLEHVILQYMYFYIFVLWAEKE